MERVLYMIGAVIGNLLMAIVELIVYAFINRRPKQTTLSLPLPVRFEHTHIVGVLPAALRFYTKSHND